MNSAEDSTSVRRREEVLQEPGKPLVGLVGMVYFAGSRKRLKEQAGGDQCNFGGGDRIITYGTCKLLGCGGNNEDKMTTLQVCVRAMPWHGAWQQWAIMGEASPIYAPPVGGDGGSSLPPPSTGRDRGRVTQRGLRNRAEQRRLFQQSVL